MAPCPKCTCTPPASPQLRLRRGVLARAGGEPDAQPPTQARRGTAGVGDPEKENSLRSVHVRGSARLPWAPPSRLRIGSAAGMTPGSANQPPFPPHGHGRLAPEGKPIRALVGEPGPEDGEQVDRGEVADGFPRWSHAASSPVVSSAAYVICTRRPGVTPWGPPAPYQASSSPVDGGPPQGPCFHTNVPWVCASRNGQPQRHLPIDTFPGSHIGILGYFPPTGGFS